MLDLMTTIKIPSYESFQSDLYGAVIYGENDHKNCKIFLNYCSQAESTRRQLKIQVAKIARQLSN